MPEDFYRSQGRWSDPGKHLEAILAASANPTKLMAAIQGITIHTGQLAQYDLSADDFPQLSRSTLSVEDRLDRALADGGAPEHERLPRNRIPGTCRDYALMMVAGLRANDMEARVRCGFADYFYEGLWEDHWVCEYRLNGGENWSLANAQLDAVHRDHYKIEFDPFHMPRHHFLTAGEAWRAKAKDNLSDNLFGHGDSRGLWFMLVNLARDLGALHKQELSDWDGWRSVDLVTDLPTDLERIGDDLANQIDTVLEKETGAADFQPPRPFWLR